MAQGPFNMNSIMDVVFEGKWHHEGEQAQVPIKHRLAGNLGKTLSLRHN